jgi:hypothetical protein
MRVERPRGAVKFGRRASTRRAPLPSGPFVAETAQRKSSDLSLDVLLAASAASVVATIVLSRFGQAGTLTGAALTPIIVTVVKELTRRPASKIVRREGGVVRPAGAPQPEGAERYAGAHEEPAEERPVFRESWWRRVRWRLTLTITAIAFGITVAFFTLPELLLGKALTSDRGTSFFSDAPRNPTPAVTTPTTTTPTTTATVTTATVTVTTPTTPTVTAPVPTVTVPTAPTAPAPTAPAPAAPPP